MYEYKTMDSKKVEDIQKYLNMLADQGWEFMQAVTAKDRYVTIFRKPKEQDAAA